MRKFSQYLPYYLVIFFFYWPLYEVINGKYVINYKPVKKKPIEEFLRPQKRFKHMFKEGNEWMIEEFQKEVESKFGVKVRPNKDFSKLSLEVTYGNNYDEKKPQESEKKCKDLLEKITKFLKYARSLNHVRFI